MEERKIFPASVVEVVDAYRLGINRGTKHKIKLRQRFLIYAVSDKEIKDPKTGKSLGRLEIPKGTGIVENVQNELALIVSDRKKPAKKTITKSNMILPFGVGVTESIEPSDELIPFDHPKLDDFAKPI